MADVAGDNMRLRDTDIGWPLEEMWVTGDLLGSADPIESGEVVLLLDVPPDELPWLAMHPVGEWVGEQLRLGKRPFLWWYRPSVWPAWNQEHRRLARFWTAADGLDQAVIEALRSQHFDDMAVVEPSPAELVEQLGVELDAARRHLRSVLDQYWSDRWRREHKGYGGSPEDHLWRAGRAVSLLLDAVGHQADV